MLCRSVRDRCRGLLRAIVGIWLSFYQFFTCLLAPDRIGLCVLWSSLSGTACSCSAWLVESRLFLWGDVFFGSTVLLRSVHLVGRALGRGLWPIELDQGTFAPSTGWVLVVLLIWFQLVLFSCMLRIELWTLSVSALGVMMDQASCCRAWRLFALTFCLLPVWNFVTMKWSWYTG